MTLGKMNAEASKIPAADLWEILELNKRTGELKWRTRPVEHFQDGRPKAKRRAAQWNGKYAGKVALNSPDPRGYKRGAIGGITVYAHRVIRAMMDGEWPRGEIDHINRDKTDNRPCNLRVVSHTENRLNADDVDIAKAKRERKRCSQLDRARLYPVAGIRRQSRKTWAARFKRDGKESYIGSFRCFGKAVMARKAAL